MKKYNVGIVGATGAVGGELLKVLAEKNFPIQNLKLLASERSKGKVINYQGTDYVVDVATPESMDGLDIVLFAGGAISKTLARRLLNGALLLLTTAALFVTTRKCRLSCRK